MPARFALLLLIALLNVPAMAAAAPAPAAPHAMAMPHGMRHEAPRPSDPCHETEAACMGCIAPATLGAPVLAAPLPLRGEPLARATPHGIPLHPARPATPPPREA